MKLEDALQYLGLTEKEAKVYLALLQMGKGSVPAISLKAEVKKPTTYVILDELRKKGLVTIIPRIKKVLYVAESPRKLLVEQKEKEETISEKMPELLAIYNLQEEKPAVKFYQGKKNVGELYREIMEEKELCVYGSIAAIHD
jgi:HTH-type transcriptional regulator, sugar sensing transcriptional regulator